MTSRSIDKYCECPGTSGPVCAGETIETCESSLELTSIAHWVTVTSQSDQGIEVKRKLRKSSGCMASKRVPKSDRRARRSQD